MWKANGRTTTLLFLDSLLPKTGTNVRCFLWRHNNPEVNYSHIWISRGWGALLEETPSNRRQERRQREIEGTSQHQEQNVECMQKNAMSVIGVSEVQWDKVK
jgi:hypothetical protein